MTPNIQTNGNALKFEDIEKAAAELGEQAGKGKDTQIKFGLKVFEGAFQGALNRVKNKHGTDIDDATKLAETYVKAQGSAVVFDSKAPNQRKLVSCLNKLIELGQWPKGGSGEPASTVNNLMTTRQKLKAKPETAKGLEDAFNTLMKYARTQTKRDQLIPNADLQGFCYKTKSNLPSPEDILDSCRKSLMKLRDGRAAQGTAKDDSAHVSSAIDNITKRLKEIAAKRGATNGPNAKPNATP